MTSQVSVLAAITVFCLGSTVAVATPLQECAQSGAPITCLDAKLKEANQRLNATLKAAQARIEKLQQEGRRSVQNAFVNSQRTFNAYRDAQCAWQAIHAAPGTSGVEYVKDCQIRATIAREQELLAFAKGEEDAMLPDEAAPQTEPAEPPAVAASDRRGVEWRLANWTANGKQRQLVPDSSITIAFDPSGKLAGNASVNRYAGTYRFDAEGRLEWPRAGFALTRMAGPQPLMAQEQAFLESLRRTVRYRAEGQQLFLESANGSVALTFSH